MLLYLLIFSPTVLDWKLTIAEHRSELLNTTVQMTKILEKTREDVFNQFDENQGSWKPLASYTIDKKQALQADMRILHETKEGQGLRLRDAYAQAGHIDSNGVLVYTYPIEKPYAVEHQEGVDTPDKPEKLKKRKMDRGLARAMARMDKEYKDIFRRG